MQAFMEEDKKVKNDNKIYLQNTGSILVLKLKYKVKKVEIINLYMCVFVFCFLYSQVSYNYKTRLKSNKGL